METATIISARNLSKSYNGFVAVDGIDFTIRNGECSGFLGPNGAGKTSAMKMISCVSPVTDGELLIHGKNVNQHQKDIKALLGVVSQADSLDPDLNVIQNLISYSRFFNMRKNFALERVWTLLESFQLQDKAYNKPDELSGGMRRRLHIARALLNEPRILVLDEPTTGLDPQTRLLVWEKLVDLKSQGTTILLTTHYMEEASYLCDWLIVMDTGKILATGSPKALIGRYVGEEVVEVKVRLAEKGSVVVELKSKGFTFEDWGDSLIMFGDDVSTALREGALDGYQIVRRPGNLEDVFLRLTGRGLREE